MALKRINKELTDLGRYVVSCCAPTACSSARMPAGRAGMLLHRIPRAVEAAAQSRKPEWDGSPWLTWQLQRPSLVLLSWSYRR